MSSNIRIEEVDSVPPPPKARVSDAIDGPPAGAGETPAEKLERKRDYLSGFLAETPPAVPDGAPGGDLHTAVVDALKEIFDPEIPVNIYDLGLIYEVRVDEEQIAHITMTLTAPNCPMAEDLVEEVSYKVAGIRGVKDCDLKLTFTPPWDRSMLSDEAKLELGLL